jgi:ABC-2 type transport system permease protein
MANDPIKPSFSPRQRFNIAFNVTLAVIVAFALVAMLNYLSSRHFTRVYLSSQTRVELSSRTVSLLKTITNAVNVTVYFDRDDDSFNDIAQLLREYQANNRKIQVRTVDYLRDPGAALDVRDKFNLGATTNKNFVIFENEGRSKVIDAKTLTQVTIEQLPPSDGENRFRRKPVAFNGEMMFTGALLAVLNPKPLKAYYLEGHGEPPLTDATEGGYSTFAGVLMQNYIEVHPLSLLGTNDIPADCNLLIIAGPAKPLFEVEVAKVEKYLSDGGRLFALVDARSAAGGTGLEATLARYGVLIGLNLVVDPDAVVGEKDMRVNAFTLHPVMNPVLGTGGLYMIVPRPVAKNRTEGMDDLPAEEIAFTGEGAYLYSDKSKKPSRWSVAVAVDETKSGIVKPRGVTRMLIVGDSFLLGNGQIGKLGNRDFLHGSINWLVDRNLVLEGVGPKPVSEFQLVVTQSQMQTLQWILLAGIPGGILLFGGMIWLARRK